MKWAQRKRGKRPPGAYPPLIRQGLKGANFRVGLDDSFQVRLPVFEGPPSAFHVFRINRHDELHAREICVFPFVARMIHAERILIAFPSSFRLADRRTFRCRTTQQSAWLRISSTPFDHTE